MIKCQCKCGRIKLIVIDALLKGNTTRCRACSRTYRSFDKSIVLFWRKINKDGPIPEHVPNLGKCWVWKGNPHGKVKHYLGRCGTFTLNGKEHAAHRASYTLHFGAIPDAKSVLHKCDNAMCVNPSHLMLGTQVDNMEDCVSKGRQVRWERNGMHKLNLIQVSEIREKHKTGMFTWRSLGLVYGVSGSQIKRIVRNRSWKNSNQQ